MSYTKVDTMSNDIVIDSPSLIPENSPHQFASLPPLNRQDFVDAHPFGLTDNPICAGEDLESWFGYGHTSKEEFAADVNDICSQLDLGLLPDEQFTAEDVMYTWAVTIDTEENEDFAFVFAKEGTDNSFPVSYVRLD